MSSHPQSPAIPRRVVVIGGGITGLAAAHRLVELDPRIEVTLLEASGRLGGVLETVRREGYLIERSADNFITNVPWGIDLCRRVEIAERLLPTDPAHRHALVVHNGRLEKIPEGFLILAPSRIWPIVTTPILSLAGKLRLAWERFVPARIDDSDESLASFATRRLGRETYERLVQPLVGGIYTADPEKLSIRATLPRFVDMERRHGSLTRGMRRQAGGEKRTGDAAGESPGDQNSSGARYSMFTAPRDGMTSLVEAVAARLPPGTVRLNAPVERISRAPSLPGRGSPDDGATGGWHVIVGGSSPHALEADAAIVAVPAPRAAQLLSDVDAELAADLEQIPHAGCAIAALTYRREQIGNPLDGFGFVVPLVERRQILSASFSSIKYAGRAPRGMVLIRAFIGGACQGELVDLDDERLRAIATEELAALLSIRGQPTQCHIVRWPATMPQYHVGHGELVARIERRAATRPGLALAGNAYRGVGVPMCIHSGETAAEQIVGEKRGR